MPTSLVVIGCGNFMRWTYVPVLQALRDVVEVRGLCDLQAANAETAAASLPGARTYTDARTMIEKESPAAIMILTNERATAATAQLALEYGLPIYLEKPPAMNEAELDALIAAEARSRGQVFTAFNRRHMPLFLDRDFATPTPRRVTGRLVRRGRQVAVYANTAVHLIDAAQWFARSQFQEWKVRFEEQPYACWTVEGRLENGAEAELKFIPDQPEFAEELLISSQEESWELQVPNKDAPVPAGRIENCRGETVVEEVQPENVTNFLEATGFIPAVRYFIGQVSSSGSYSLHRLTQTRSTVRIMDEMRKVAGLT